MSTICLSHPHITSADIIYKLPVVRSADPHFNHDHWPHDLHGCPCLQTVFLDITDDVTATLCDKMCKVIGQMTKMTCVLAVACMSQCLSQLAVTTDLGTDSGPHPVHCRSIWC